MARMLFSVFAILLLLTPLPAQDGLLERARREVNDESSGTPAPVRPPSPPRDAGADDRADDSSSDGSYGWYGGAGSYGSYGADGWSNSDPEGALAGVVVMGGVMVAGAAVAAPFVAPRWLLADEGRSLYFPRHPYDRGYPGFLALDVDASKQAAERWQGENTPRWWMARVSIENGNDFDGLNRLGGQVLLDTASRFGIVTNWDHFRESLGVGRDVTTIGDITFLCRFAQSENVLMRAGIGARIMTDEHATNAGVNLHYGGEWFPSQPWVLTGGIDIGNLGDAFVFRARASAGVLWHGVEAFGGYDLLRIGDVNLHGPMVGVRFWF